MLSTYVANREAVLGHHDRQADDVLLDTHNAADAADALILRLGRLAAGAYCRELVRQVEVAR